MLGIPVTSTSGKKKLPYATLLLILINCFVFFFIQSDHNEAFFNAYTYYEDSGLIETELEAYLGYLDYSEEQVSGILNRPEERDAFSFTMLQDDTFQYKLRHDESILAGSPEYAEWKEDRAECENLLGQSVTHRYGYSPADRNYTALFTYQFLHGGIIYLVGNMVFLWLVGGLLSGSARAAVHHFTIGSRFDELFKEDKQKNRLEELLERGQTRMASLDLRGARKDMEKVLEIEPDNPLAIRSLYTIDKAKPQSEAYCQSASRLLSLLMRGNSEDFLDIFEEYKRLSGKPRINTAMISRLLPIYLKKKRLKEASACLLGLTKKST